MGASSFPPFLAFLAASLGFYPAAASPQSAPMSPTAKWVVNYAESMCVLSRDYGSGENQITLGFRPGPLSDYIRIAILFPDTSRIARGKAQIRFDGGEAVPAPFMSGPTKTEGAYILLVDTKRSELHGFEAAKTMSIAAGKFAFNLALPDLTKAMAALKECEKDLLVSWGMDRELIAQLATMPSIRNGIASIFSTDDYPSAAVRESLQGTSGIRFWVSKDGKPSDCKIVETSGTKVLDQQSCGVVLRRGKFDPARTIKGDAIASPAFVRIRWELPGD